MDNQQEHQIRMSKGSSIDQINALLTQWQRQADLKFKHQSLQLDLQLRELSQRVDSRLSAIEQRLENLERTSLDFVPTDATSLTGPSYTSDQQHHYLSTVHRTSSNSQCSGSTGYLRFLPGLSNPPPASNPLPAVFNLNSDFFEPEDDDPHNQEWLEYFDKIRPMAARADNDNYLEPFVELLKRPVQMAFAHRTKKFTPDPLMLAMANLEGVVLMYAHDSDLAIALTNSARLCQLSNAKQLNEKNWQDRVGELARALVEKAPFLKPSEVQYALFTLTFPATQAIPARCFLVYSKLRGVAEEIHGNHWNQSMVRHLSEAVLKFLEYVESEEK